MVHSLLTAVLPSGFEYCGVPMRPTVSFSSRLVEFNTATTLKMLSVLFSVYNWRRMRLDPRPFLNSEFCYTVRLTSFHVVTFIMGLSLSLHWYSLYRQQI